MWLAETSQQPINQTTWLKVTPHCNHCKKQIEVERPVYTPLHTLLLCLTVFYMICLSGTLLVVYEICTMDV